MDILLDSELHDIIFDNTDNPLVTDEARLDVAQRLKIKLSTFLGEWFLNTENGVPYFQQIYGRGKRKSSIDLIFQTQILEEPEVIEIVEFNSTLDNSTREYNLSFRVRIPSGTTDLIII